MLSIIKKKRKLEEEIKQNFDSIVAMSASFQPRMSDLNPIYVYVCAT
jgi:hypothetical protein